MRQLKPLILLAAIVVAVTMWQRHAPAPENSAANTTTSSSASAQQTASAATSASFLPPEADDVLALIARGGPFAHRQDGTVFGNYEGRLPKQPRGFYHEYTVETPNAHNRGARRIITGGEPPTVYYYSADHYRTFRRFQAIP
ncbi:MAG: ribonuclease domain-containing protein [Rhodanobacter sp.]